MSLATKLKELSHSELGSLAFYAITGIIMLACLPIADFPPHVGFLGILSLIVAYSLFTKRGWAPWLAGILFVAGIVFSGYTLYSIGFSNALVGLGMLGYAVLVVIISMYVLLKRKP